MGVVVAFRGHVVWQLLVGRKPSIDVLELLADVITLVEPW